MSRGPLVWRLRLTSPPEEVFRFLSTDEGRRRFWAEEAPEVEGVICFRFIGGTRTEAPVVRCEPPGVFEIRYFGARVRFLLTDLDGGTDLELRSWEIPEAEWEEVLPGWVSVLLHLKAAVDHGIDLRSGDPDRAWDQRYVDQ